MRLALALGKTLKQLLTEMDARELMMWEAYYRIEPFGQDRADAAVAINTSVLATIHSKKGASVSPQDFLPKWDKPKGQDIDQIKAIFREFKKDTEGKHSGT